MTAELPGLMVKCGAIATISIPTTDARWLKHD